MGTVQGYLHDKDLLLSYLKMHRCRLNTPQYLNEDGQNQRGVVLTAKIAVELNKTNV